MSADSADSYYDSIKHDPARRSAYNLGAAMSTVEALARTLRTIQAEGLDGMQTVIALDLARVSALLEQVSDR